MPLSIKKTEQVILEELSFFGDWEDKYSYIIDSGRNLPRFNDAWKNDENKIDGCLSQVWLHHEISMDGEKKLLLFASADALIVSGLIVLLLRLYDKRKPEDILQHDTHWIKESGFSSYLSPTRQNGFLAIINRIFTLAEIYSHS